MARIRTIKPDFFSSEQVVSVSFPARLLFQGLWVFGDDEGRGKASAVELKAKVFPADSLSAGKVEDLLQELVRVKLVELYEVDGVRYWRVPGFAHHQRINRPQPAKTPPPPGGVTDHSVNPHRDAAQPHAPPRSVQPHARVQIPSLPIHSLPEGGLGETEPDPEAPDPIGGWGRHALAIQAGAQREPWRCAEAAFAAAYRALRGVGWKATAGRSGVAIRDIAAKVEAIATSEGRSQESVIDAALERWFGDRYAASIDFNISTLAEQFERNYRPPIAGLAAVSPRGEFRPGEGLGGLFGETRAASDGE